MSAVSRIHLEVCKLLRVNLRLRLVKPEVFNAVVVVIFLYLVPVELSRFGVGGVYEGDHSEEVKGRILTVFRSHKHVAVVHLVPVFALGAYRRPHRHDRLNSHFFKFVAHGLGIGPVLGVKLEVALLRPVEEVYYNRVYRYSTALVLPCHVQKYVLRLVAALALPESRRPLGHHGAVAGEVCVCFHYVLGRVADKNYEVRLICAVRNPHGVVKCRFASSGSGVVPKESVSQRGIVEGDDRLCVVVNKLGRCALAVERILLLLTESVNVLAVVCVENVPYAVVVALGVHVTHDVVAVVFGGEYLLALAHEAKLAAPVVCG